MARTVLRGWAQTNAIRKGGLEAVKVVPNDIYVIIRDQAREVLPHTSAHDAGLSVVHPEAFLHQNRGDMD